MDEEKLKDMILDNPSDTLEYIQRLTAGISLVIVEIIEQRQRLNHNMSDIQSRLERLLLGKDSADA